MENNTANKDLELVSYRVDGSGVDYYSKKFSKDDIIKRRAILRKLLMNTGFRNSSNNELDGMIVTKISEDSYIVEEQNGYETVTGYKNTPNAATNNDKGK